MSTTQVTDVRDSVIGHYRAPLGNEMLIIIQLI